MNVFIYKFNYFLKKNLIKNINIYLFFLMNKEKEKDNNSSSEELKIMTKEGKLLDSDDEV